MNEGTDTLRSLLQSSLGELRWSHENQLLTRFLAFLHHILPVPLVRCQNIQKGVPPTKLCLLLSQLYKSLGLVSPHCFQETMESRKLCGLELFCIAIFNQTT